MISRDHTTATTGAAHPEFVILPDRPALYRAAAERFVTLSRAHQPFTVALSGGSTPYSLYEILSAPPYLDRVNWAQVHLFWGDERCVPPDHPDSNYGMARRALIDHVAIPPGHVHRIQGELAPQEAAAHYRRELDAVLGHAGQLDLILLGMGEDGHTASLFPGTTALAEQTRSAVAVYVERLHSWRVTLTLPVINAARHVLFLVAGASKSDALSRIRAGERLPAGLVRPADGQLTWLLDHQAAQTR